ncbi:MAG: TaqI-like C-terminal specificity domain-containing protein [Candidatus Omnitrophota bacterium]
MKNIIKQSLEGSFNLDNFSLLVKNIFNKIDINPQEITVFNGFEEHIKSLTFLGEYCDSQDKNLDVLAIELIGDTKIERARSFQRNIVAKYLKNNTKDSSLVAFYSQGNPDWRLSFVKLDYKLTDKGPRAEVGTPAKRYSFLVGETEPSHTAQAQLLPILEKQKENPSISEIEEVFSVEKVTKEFYEKYLDLFKRLSRNLERNKEFEDIANKEQIDIENFTKKLIGQIVFLYFLQKKGWLGVPRKKSWGEGDKFFLRTLFDKAEKEKGNFYNDYLEILFYDTLNNPRKDKDEPEYSTYFDCKIPFLNGGLFGPDYDWKNTTVKLSNEIFEDIISTFDIYNFTVKEDDPLEKEIAVDPEMLGKVFENLLPENLRKGRGAYYTPREIVHYMCQESLINHLSTETKVDIEKVRKLVNLSDSGISKNEAESIDKAISSIKVCDPACGSGAFLVGMLHEIVNTRHNLTNLLNLEGKDLKERGEYNLKKQAIENCIYGVDIDPGAVDIAKLRLWLSLVVDYDEEVIKPLPNLDYRIMCGNSLLEEFEGVRFYDGSNGNGEKSLFKDERKEKIEELRRKTKEYFNIFDDEEKHNKSKEINKLKDWFIRTTLEKRRKKITLQRKKIEANVNMFNSESQKEYFVNQKHIFISEAKINEVLQNLHNPQKARPFFIWKLEFMDVFEEKGGFDVIMANPPYGIIFKDDLKEEYEGKYNTFLRNNDIYVAFIERGIDLIQNNGMITYITPNTYQNGDYFIKLRNFMISNLKIFEILDFKNIPVFDDPTVFVSIFNAQKNNSGSSIIPLGIVISYKERMERVLSLIRIDKGDKNLFFKPQNQIIQKFIKDCSIEEFDKVFYIKDVGFNYWTVGKGKKRDGNSIGDRIFYAGKRLSESDIPFLKGRNIDRFFIQEPDNYLRHNYKDFLNSKFDVFRFSKEFLEISPKIIYRQTSADIKATIDHGKNYLDKTVHLIVLRDINLKINLKYVLSLLNSKLFQYLYAYISQESYGRTFAQVKTTYIKKLPFKKISEDEQISFVKLVDRILSVTKDEDYLTNSVKQAKVKEYEHQINQMVYKLYGLTKEEIEVVESFNKK